MDGRGKTAVLVQAETHDRHDPYEDTNHGECTIKLLYKRDSIIIVLYESIFYISVLKKDFFNE